MRNVFTTRRVAALATATALGALAVPLSSTAAGATEATWLNTAGTCIGSGSGSGGEVTVSVADYALLNSADYNQPVKWRVWLHEYDPQTGDMRWQLMSDWRTYTPLPDGGTTDGSIQQSSGGTQVNIGGTTAPGVDQAPVVSVISAGWWVKPYIEATNSSGDVMTHTVPIDANSVGTDDTYGCYFS